MTYTNPNLTITVPNTRKQQRVRSRDWPRPPRQDPHTRVIAQLLAMIGGDSSVIATSSRPWASATFVGTKHKIILKLSGADHETRTERFARTLPDAEFSITGHIVADACVDERRPDEDGGTIMRLCVLTIEDW